jgi:chromosome segregation ATPase
MHDEMSAGLADAKAAEEAAIQTYEALMKAKKEEVAALSAQIEAEITRVGELGVEIAGMENDLEETKEALAEDTNQVSGRIKQRL